jgi:CRP/FNR family transcriptional regulator, cyclic AMP receptor protein
MEEAVKQLTDIPAINRFLSYCRVRTVPSKTALIHAGDLPDVLYYIIRGSVEVMIEDEEGNEMVLAYLNKGQFFGEMGLFSDSQQRSAWVRTRTQCELAEMTYPRFRQVASESPGLVFELATQLATRLDRTNRKLGDLAFVDVTGRIAHAIMDLCGEPDAMTHPQGMQIKVSRQELSRLVGCSREMAGRVLKVLEEQGLLTARGKTIVVFGARPKVKARAVPEIAKASAAAAKSKGTLTFSAFGGAAATPLTAKGERPLLFRYASRGWSRRSPSSRRSRCPLRTCRPPPSQPARCCPGSPRRRLRGAPRARSRRCGASPRQA